jgi:hypothetical protein
LVFSIEWDNIWVILGEENRLKKCSARVEISETGADITQKI